jgi:hypothetical protein
MYYQQDQWIDLGVAGGAVPLPDGGYAVQSIADPLDLILESDDSNNAALTYFRVRFGQIELLAAPDPTPAPTLLPTPAPCSTCEGGVLISPTPGTTLPGGTVTFAWSSGTGVSEYVLQVGSTAGGSDLFISSVGQNRSVTVSGLPADGRTIYVRLSSLIGADWRRYDAVYRAASKPGSGLSADINGDGAVTAQDALCVQRAVAALPAITGCAYPLAHSDVNGNGRTDVVDALCVLRYVAGLPAAPTCPLQQ